MQAHGVGCRTVSSRRVCEGAFDTPFFSFCFLLSLTLSKTSLVRLAFDTMVLYL